MFGRNQFFHYATVSDLRNENLSESAATDERAKLLIKRASMKINYFTTQWFFPVKGIVKLDGDNSPMVTMPNLVPFVKVDSIDIIPEKSTAERLESVCGFNIVRDKRELGLINQEDFAISDNGRYLELVNISASEDLILSSGSVFVAGGEYREFPRGRKNVLVDGVFGFIEDSKDAQDEIISTINLGDNLAFISDASQFDKNDVLAFEISPKEKYIYTICTGVDIVQNKIMFESIETSIPLGAKVFSHGKVPNLINYCCVKLAIIFSKKIGDIYGGSAINHFYHTTIQRERSDQYEYRTDPGSMSNYNPGYVLGTTGDGEVDSILQEFVPPPWVDVV